MMIGNPNINQTASCIVMTTQIGCDTCTCMLPSYSFDRFYEVYYIENLR